MCKKPIMCCTLCDCSIRERDDKMAALRSSDISTWVMPLNTLPSKTQICEPVTSSISQTSLCSTISSDNN